MSTNEQIRGVLAAYGRLTVDVEQLADDADLFAVGLESHSAVSVMLALEEILDFEFPDDRLRRTTFGSIASLAGVIAEVKA
jgi:acyl carrier protein